MEQLKNKIAQAKKQKKKSLTVNLFLDNFTRNELIRLGYTLTDYKAVHNGTHFEYSHTINWL